MNIEDINRRKQEIIKKFGNWTAHNILLKDNVYTIDGKRVVGDEIKLRRIVQVICDIVDKPLENLRILDLACLEGLYAIELARHGAKVVAIESREANIEKARFAKEVLNLNNLDLIQDDVRNLSIKKYGHFDAVLCLGILYHLDVPDVFHFLERVAEICQRFLIIDSHVSVAAKQSYFYKGKEYWGRSYEEHSQGSTPEERSKALWSSLDNLNSFWFTRPSLYNLLGHVGFTSVYECHNPPEIRKSYDRVTLMAIKGQSCTLISSPLINILSHHNWPEKQQMSVHLSQRWYYSVVKKLSRCLPPQLIRLYRNLVQ